MQTRHLVIAAAGTGGHVMPGIAVAKEMERKGWSVSWLGTNAGMERRLVERVGITCDTVNFSGLRGKGIAHAVTGAFKLIGAYFNAVSLLKRTKANALFTTGGYIAVPSVLAAKTLGLPVFVMNCDADVLMSVRAVMPFAKRVFCGFEGAAARLAKDKAVVTGNPVRKEILSVPNATERLAGRTGSLRILVFGGSLGARVLNETVPKALAMFEPGKRPSVVHQCGAKNLESTRAAYDAQGVMATIEPFIDDMALAYSRADIVICRAGATSVSELAAAGMPSILVPFIAKTTSHQVGNALFMQEAGGAFYVPQKECTAEKLYDILSGLDRLTLIKMGDCAKAIARPDAAVVASEEIEALSR